MRRSRTALIAAVCLAAGALLSTALQRGPALGQDAPGAGAKVIDASKYADLQAAFDAVPAGGGVVRLPPGRFEITRPLVLTRGDTRVEGAGAATVLVNANTQGEPALILRPADYPKKPASRVWRVQLADFRVTGNPRSGDGVLAQGVNEIYLHGVSVDHNGGHGVSLVDCYEDPRVCDSILTYNGKVGLHILRSHDIVVSGNQFEENEDALHCIDSFNLCMTGNNLDDHLRHGVLIEDTYGSVLSGNMIEECKEIAIVLDRDCYGITVSANVIAHNFGGGVDLRDAWGCAVSANTFTIVPKFGVRVGPDAGRVAVTGNSFSDAHIGGKVKRDDAAAGVHLVRTSDVAVTGNTFTGLAGPAVEQDGECRRVQVAGNVMADLYRAGGTGPGVRGPGDLGPNSIEEPFQPKQ